MQLTDEQRKAIEWAIGMASQHNIHNSPLRALLAAHSAGAQEPEWCERCGYPCRCAHPQPITDAARAVLAERHRQVTVEGWTPAHDDEHTGCSLAVAAACYALFAAADNSDSADAWIQEWRKTARCLWPYAKEWQKTTTPRRDLVKAGALILAEIERLDRAKGE